MNLGEGENQTKQTGGKESQWLWEFMLLCSNGREQLWLLERDTLYLHWKPLTAGLSELHLVSLVHWLSSWSSQ